MRACGTRVCSSPAPRVAADRSREGVGAWSDAIPDRASALRSQHRRAECPRTVDLAWMVVLRPPDGVEARGCADARTAPRLHGGSAARFLGSRTHWRLHPPLRRPAPGVGGRHGRSRRRTMTGGAERHPPARPVPSAWNDRHPLARRNRRPCWSAAFGSQLPSSYPDWLTSPLPREPLRVERTVSGSSPRHRPDGRHTSCVEDAPRPPPPHDEASARPGLVADGDESIEIAPRFWVTLGDGRSTPCDDLPQARQSPAGRAVAGRTAAGSSPVTSVIHRVRRARRTGGVSDLRRRT